MGFGNRTSAVQPAAGAGLQGGGEAGKESQES